MGERPTKPAGTIGTADTSPWSRADTVAGFVRSAPNPNLLRFAEMQRASAGAHRLVDLGCGAGRNAVPLAQAGWEVLGIDLSVPMLHAAAERASAEGVTGRVRLARAAMEAVPARDRSFDLVVAHGIWNLARSAVEFRAAVREAARVARPGAGLFVFTFSRATLPDDVSPVAGEPFVFTQFSGEPQCFLTAEQLIAEMRDGGFSPDARLPMRHLNAPAPGQLRTPGVPVIYEAVFRRV